MSCGRIKSNLGRRGAKENELFEPQSSRRRGCDRETRGSSGTGWRAAGWSCLRYLSSKRVDSCVFILVVILPSTSWAGSIRTWIPSSLYKPEGDGDEDCGGANCEYCKNYQIRLHLLQFCTWVVISSVYIPELSPANTV